MSGRRLPAVRSINQFGGKPREDLTMCEHHNFDAAVRVGRIEDKGRFMAEIRITCRDCGTPMQFVGLEPGFNFDGATVSLDGLEANIGIHPHGQRPNPFQQLVGYSVKARN